MKKGRVLLGMSGGVDSSVSALLLKNEGYEVIGVTLSLSNHTDAKDAKEVCDKLGIEHISIDMQESFKKYVIDNSGKYMQVFRIARRKMHLHLTLV